MASLQNTKNLLLVIGSDLQYVHYLNLVVLIEILQKRGAVIDLFLTEAITSIFRQAAPLPEVKTIDKLSARRFVLSFPRNAAPIKSVQWNQTNDKLTFHIRMEKGIFTADGMEFKAEGSEYDAVLFYQVSNFSQISELFLDYPQIWEQATAISIGTEIKPEGAHTEHIIPAASQLFTACIYEALKGLNPNKEHYTLFFAGLLAETDRFNTKDTNAEAFLLSAELLGNGANLEYANKLSEGQPTQPVTAERNTTA